MSVTKFLAGFAIGATIGAVAGIDMAKKTDETVKDIQRKADHLISDAQEKSEEIMNKLQDLLNKQKEGQEA